MFHRDSGHSTIYVGSSNLSSAALLDGMEWNVRLNETDNPPILRKFGGTFEKYWNDGEFHTYHKQDAALVDSLLARARGHDRGETSSNDLLLRLDFTPKPHQQQILEALAAERQQGHRRNLVVAATGTGKTWVAAFDLLPVRDHLCAGNCIE